MFFRVSRRNCQLLRNSCARVEQNWTIAQLLRNHCVTCRDPCYSDPNTPSLVSLSLCLCLFSLLFSRRPFFLASLTLHCPTLWQSCRGESRPLHPSTVSCTAWFGRCWRCLMSRSAVRTCRPLLRKEGHLCLTNTHLAWFWSWSPPGQNSLKVRKELSEHPRNRGPPTTYRHHKGLRIKKGLSKGVVYELSEPNKTAKCIPPPGLHWRCSSWLLWGWCADCGVRRKSTKSPVSHSQCWKTTFPELLPDCLHQIREHVWATSEPGPNQVRTTSAPHPNRIRAASEPHPKQWQKLREKCWRLVDELQNRKKTEIQKIGEKLTRSNFCLFFLEFSIFGLFFPYFQNFCVFIFCSWLTRCQEKWFLAPGWVVTFDLRSCFSWNL